MSRISRPPHTVNHSSGGGWPAVSSSPLLFFHGHQQSGSGQKAPQIKMGTPVISLHRWSTPVADCFHHYGGKKGAFMVPEANSSDRQRWFT